MGDPRIHGTAGAERRKAREAEGPFAQMAVDQRIADNLPCPACGGDRLRPRFDGPGLCHVGGLISDCTCPGSRSIGMEHMDDCPAR